MTIDEPELAEVIKRTLGEDHAAPDPDDVLTLYFGLPAVVEDGGVFREQRGTVDGITEIVARQHRRHVRSSFEASFRDARHVSDGGRSWIGAIGYLVFLDGLGGAVQPIDQARRPSGSDLERALEMFTDCDRRQRCALYALRCCLAHDFSLANLAEDVSKKNQHLYRHYFNLPPARQLDGIAEFPDEPWDGNYESLRPTFVDIGRLEDVATEAHDSALAAWVDGCLELRVPALEARHRFIFGHPEEIGVDDG